MPAARVVVAHGVSELATAVAIAEALEKRGCSAWVAARDAMAEADSAGAQQAAIAQAGVVVVLSPADVTAKSPLVEAALRDVTAAQRCLSFQVDDKPVGPFVETVVKLVAHALELPPGSELDAPAEPDAVARPRPRRQSSFPPPPPPPPKPRAASLLVAWIATALLAVLVCGALAWLVIAGRRPTSPPRAGASPDPPTAAAQSPAPSAGAQPGGLAVTGIHHSAGWFVMFHLQNELWPRTLGYRIGTEGPFISTGVDVQVLDPATLQPRPKMMIDVRRIPSVTTFQVVYTDHDGVARGPFSASFDPVVEVTRTSKAALESMRTWVELHSGRKKVTANFGAMLSTREGITSIRYGVDTMEPFLVFHFTPDGETPPRDSSEMTPLELPRSTRFISVVVQYRDGTSSPVRRFDVP